MAFACGPHLLCLPPGQAVAWKWWARTDAGLPGQDQLAISNSEMAPDALPFLRVWPTWFAGSSVGWRSTCSSGFQAWLGALPCGVTSGKHLTSRVSVCSAVYWATDLRDSLAMQCFGQRVPAPGPWGCAWSWGFWPAVPELPIIVPK